jgi:hypothetical protein
MFYKTFDRSTLISVAAAIAFTCNFLAATSSITSASEYRQGATANPEIDSGNRGVRVGYGAACLRDSIAGPPSYPSNLVGEPGFPRLSGQNIAVLRRIMKYIHSGKLRFVFLSNSRDKHRFIVFNASRSRLCDPTVPPFIVLNGACNEYYSPSNVMFATSAAMGCVNPPRPWIQGDRGTGKTSWSSQSVDP